MGVQHYLPISFSDVLAAIENEPDLNDQQRRDLRSAIMRACRLAAAGNVMAPVSAPHLGAVLGRHSAAMLRLSEGAFANLKSRCLRALRIAGARVRSSRSSTPLSPAWSALLARATHKPLFGLHRFASYASEQGWDPSGITDGHVERFVAMLRSEAMIRDPAARGRSVARLWNRAAASIPGWPPQRLAERRERRGYCLPWTAFPPSLLADVEAFFASRNTADPFGGTARAWKPATIQNRREVLRMACSAIVLQGHPIETLTSLEAVTRPAAIRSALMFHYGRAGNRITDVTRTTHSLLHMIARDHVKRSEPELEAIKEFGLSPEMRPKRRMSPKNQARLRQFDDPRVVAAYLSLPDALMKRARKEPAGSPAAARHAATALALELLTFSPMRRANIIGLDLIKHFKKVTPGADSPLHLVIPAGEVKNEVPLEFPIQRQTRKLLEEYVRDFRPHLGDAGTSWLFPGRSGGHIKPLRLYDWVCQAGREIAGIELTPHLARHIAARLFLDSEPGRIGVVSRVLGHRSTSTTQAHYVDADIRRDVEHFDRVVLQRRTESAAQGFRAPRRRRP